MSPLRLCTILLLVMAAALWPHSSAISPPAAWAQDASSDEFHFRPSGRQQSQWTYDVAINMIADGAYDDAAAHLATLLHEHPQDLLPAGANRYLPLWLAVAEKSSQWPPEASAALANALQPNAAETRLRAENQELSLAELEAAAQSYFVSSDGARMAMALGDRLRERGWPTLALFYYRLLAEYHDDRHTMQHDLTLRANLAARLAGLNDESLRASGFGVLKSASHFPEPQDKALRWLLNVADDGNLRLRGHHADGRGVVSSGIVPRQPVISWQRPFASRAGGQINQFYSRSPAVYLSVDNGRLYLSAWKNPLAVDIAGGESPWPVEARPEMTRSVGASAIQPAISPDLIIAPVYHARQGVLNNSHLYRVHPRSPLHIVLEARETDGGSQRWTWDPRTAGLDVADISVEGQPLIIGDIVVVALGTPGSFFGEFQTAALDLRSGSMLWQTPIASFGNDLFVMRRNNQTITYGNYMTTSLASRDGIILATQSGLSCAQSAISGNILWLNRLPDIAPASVQLPSVAGRPATVAAGSVASMPRILADGHRVFCGSIFAPHVQAYHLLSGQLLWTRASEDARQPFAVHGGSVYLWGQSIVALSADSGAPRWRAEPADSLIMGEPCLADNAVVATTETHLWVVNARNGRDISSAPLPQNVEPGNVLVTPQGLLIGGDNQAWCLQEWSTIEQQMLLAARQNATTPEPFLRLAQMAFSVDDVDNVLKYLRLALARQNRGAVAGQIYRMAETVYLKHRPEKDQARLKPILTLMAAAAEGAENQTRQMLLSGEFHMDIEENPTAALAVFQRIMSRPEWRDVEHRNWVMTGPAALLAEQRISRLMGRRGSQIYEPFETQAAAAMARAAEAASTREMMEVTRRYPNSRAAIQAVERAAMLDYQAGKLGEAYNLLLVRINLATQDDDEFGRLNALAAHVALKLQRPQQAAYHAAVSRKLIAERTPVAMPDGSTTTPADLAAAIRRNLQSQAAQPPLEAVPTTLAAAWQANLEQVATLDPRSGIDDRRRRQPNQHDQPVVVTMATAVAAFNGQSGDRLWHVPTDRRHGTRVLVMDDTVFMANGPLLSAFDIETGKLRWQTRSSPVPRDAAPGLVAVSLYGDVAPQSAQTAAELPNETAIVDLDLLHGFLAVTTSCSVRLVTLDTGYTAARIGDNMANPTNSRTYHIIGDRVVGLFDRAPVITGYRIYDLHTRRRVAAAGFDQPMHPAPGTTQPLLLAATRQNENNVTLVDVSGGEDFKVELSLTNIDAVVADDKALYVAGSLGEVVCIDIASRKVRWRSAAGKDAQSRANTLQLLSDNRLLHGSTRTLRVLSRQDGHPVWHEQATGTGRYQLVGADDRQAVVLAGGALWNWNLENGQAPQRLSVITHNIIQILPVSSRGFVLFHGNRTITWLEPAPD